ncbi:MAG: methylenetetrahydrofolate reductase C-terminal domain-containing protein [Deltaproteobacteria bacterium]|nr:methylenetetrahydrofolate reductase C-terminal domain-containing protein [Deltaproteobacteria bacterium]
MIVGEQKPLEEIWDMIKDHQKVLVFGCNTCVAVCQQGGNKEAEILASLLRMKATQEGVDIEITHSGIERQCEHEFFEKAEDEIQEAEAVLTTACGIGVQFMAEKYPKQIYPGLNTTFLGAVEKMGVYTERCQACGHCVLGQTGGICPVARCAKRVLNGPCGGSTNGKCEISKEVGCAWQLIIDRLSLLGRLEADYEKLTPIKDWSTDRAGGPRKLVREDLVNE